MKLITAVIVVGHRKTIHFAIHFTHKFILFMQNACDFLMLKVVAVITIMVKTSAKHFNHEIGCAHFWYTFTLSAHPNEMCAWQKKSDV